MEVVGVIVENFEFYLYLIGWENFKYFVNMYKKIVDEWFDEVVECVGLILVIYDKVKIYFFGMC